MRFTIPDYQCEFHQQNNKFLLVMTTSQEVFKFELSYNEYKRKIEEFDWLAKSYLTEKDKSDSFLKKIIDLLNCLEPSVDLIELEKHPVFQGKIKVTANNNALNIEEHNSTLLPLTQPELDTSDDKNSKKQKIYNNKEEKCDPEQKGEKFTGGTRDLDSKISPKKRKMLIKKAATADLGATYPLALVADNILRCNSESFIYDYSPPTSPNNVFINEEAPTPPYAEETLSEESNDIPRKTAVSPTLVNEANNAEVKQSPPANNGNDHPSSNDSAVKMTRSFAMTKYSFTSKMAADPEEKTPIKEKSKNKRKHEPTNEIATEVPTPQLTK